MDLLKDPILSSVCVRVHVPINMRRHSNGVPKALSEGIYTKQSKWLSFNKIIQNLYKIHLRERSQVVYAKICQTNSILNPIQCSDICKLIITICTQTSASAQQDIWVSQPILGNLWRP